MQSGFQLLLFSTEPGFIASAVAAGVDAIVVDWENSGKERRQAAADTQINYDTIDDLKLVRATTDTTVICRVNNCASTLKEVEDAIAAGADEILLPMVRTVAEVVTVLEQVGDRCGVGILMETEAGVGLASELAQLPLSRVYVGLNDLAIERRASNIFTALVDGTVERVRKEFSVPFGFGGLTLPDCGFPIPCRLLIGELVRLECEFSFLRRSFHRDIHGRHMNIEVPRIRGALDKAGGRTAARINQDLHELEKAVAAWRTGTIL